MRLHEKYLLGPTWPLTATLALVIPKLLGLIGWSWWVVFAPLLLGFAWDTVICAIAVAMRGYR